MEVMEMIGKPANQIGESKSGILYHGKLPTGQEVVVKVWRKRLQILHSAANEFFEFKKVRSPNV
jgi:RIO-like serine/threonine protein kinase